MAHSHHDHSHSHSHESDMKGLKSAFLLNFSFSILEIIGGIWTNSTAIISDAVHDMGDAITIASSIAFEKYSQKKKSNSFSYGYRRFSLLGALISTLVLLVGSVAIIVNVVPKLLNPSEVNSMGMLWFSFAGIAFNGLAVLRLKKGTESTNKRAVMLHLMEDLLGWVAVLVGSIVIKFTGWFIIDPILSIIISIYILTNVYKNIADIMRVLLQGTPSKEIIGQITETLENMDEIKEVHDLHIWSLDGQDHIVSAHLVVDESVSKDKIAEIKGLAKKLLIPLSIVHSTFEIESENEECEECIL